jgi:hypothetical protein
MSSSINSCRRAHCSGVIFILAMSDSVVIPLDLTTGSLHTFRVMCYHDRVIHYHETVIDAHTIKHSRARA